MLHIDVHNVCYSTAVRTGVRCRRSRRSLQGRKWDRCGHGRDRSGGVRQRYKLRIVGLTKTPNTDSTVLPQVAAPRILHSPWIGHDPEKRSWVSECSMGTHSDPHDRFFYCLIVFVSWPQFSLWSHSHGSFLKNSAATGSCVSCVLPDRGTFKGPSEPCPPGALTPTDA
jgi:hypothetical protein